MPITCGAALAMPAQSTTLSRNIPEKIMSAHMTPEQVRSKIDHPIVDGDGHWVEYDPVFTDKQDKVGGGVAPGRVFEGDGGDPRGAHDVGRRTAPQAHWSVGLLEPPGGKHARPRYRHDAEAALRSPRRAGARLCHRLPDRP